MSDTPPPLPRLLCVDDEPHVLEGLQRTFRGHFDIVTEVSGRAAIERLKNESFGVIMSDMRMPEMDGVAVLKAAHAMEPSMTRVLLTGQADLEAAIAAVNEGHVFRFLIKPCDPDQMRRALDDAFEQHRLINAEKELLERTLKGALKVCIDVLGLVHPEALARGARVRRMASLLAARVGGVELWAMEVAALLANFGAITLPKELMERMNRGLSLSVGDLRLVDRLPVIAAELVGSIPRLEHVRDMLLFQRTQYDGLQSPTRGTSGEDLPLGARILLLADDHDMLEMRGLNPAFRLRALEGRLGRYDPKLLKALRDILYDIPPAEEPVDDGFDHTTLERAAVGSILADDVVGANGYVMIAKGQEVSEALFDRIRFLEPEMRQKAVRLERRA